MAARSIGDARSPEACALLGRGPLDQHQLVGVHLGRSTQLCNRNKPWLFYQPNAERSPGSLVFPRKTPSGTMDCGFDCKPGRGRHDAANWQVSLYRNYLSHFIRIVRCGQKKDDDAGCGRLGYGDGYLDPVDLDCANLFFHRKLH